MHDQFRRVMGVLRGPRQSGPLLLARQRLKLHPDLFPALTEGFTGSRKQAVGQLAGTKSRELRQHRLFLRRCIATFGLKFGQQSDRRQVVPRPRFPALGQVTCATETEVDLRRHNRGCSGFFREDAASSSARSPGRSPQNRVLLPPPRAEVSKKLSWVLLMENSGQAAASGAARGRPGARKTG